MSNTLSVMLADATTTTKQKRGRNCYQLYCDSKRPEVRAELKSQLAPGTKLNGLTIEHELARRWRAETQDERDLWKVATHNKSKPSQTHVASKRAAEMELWRANEAALEARANLVQVPMLARWADDGVGTSVTLGHSAAAAATEEGGWTGSSVPPVEVDVRTLPGFSMSDGY